MLIFVESNTTGTGMIALRTAVRLGLKPVLFAKDPGRYLGLAETGCEVVVCDTDDPEGLQAAVAEHAGGRVIAGVTTTSEYYLEPTAGLAEALGLTAANPPGAVAVCRNKALTREALRAAGVAQPRFAVVRDSGEAEAAVRAVGLPCVVKPADDSGSHDVLWCDDVATAVAHAEKVLAIAENVRGQATARTVLVEEYLSGPEYSAEMFCGDDGVVCVGITERTVSALPYFVETGHMFPAALAADVAASVAAVAAAALTAAGFRRGPAHVELKLTASGPAVVEINGRLAGGMIPELVRPATGIDLLEQQVRAAAGLPVRLAADRAGHAGVRFLRAERAGRLVEVAGVERAERVPGVDRVVVTGAAGRPVRPVQDAYDRLGCVIAVGKDAAEVAAALDAAMAEIEVVVE